MIPELGLQIDTPNILIHHRTLQYLQSHP